MKITGALQVPSNPKVIQDLTFANPFEEHKEFRAFFEHQGSLIIPRAYPIDTKGFIEDLVDSPCVFDLAEGYALRDYQSSAISEILTYFSERSYGQLLLTAQPGSGKTYMLSGLLNKLNQRTLVISHLSMLSAQMYSELISGLTSKSIKILEAKDLGKELPDIAICTYQLLDSNSNLLKQLAEHYGFVVVDEADNSFSRSRLKVLFRLKPKYQLYMTATPTKDLMKQTKGLVYLFGPKSVEMLPPEENKVHSKHLMVDFSALRWDSPQNTNMYKTSLGKFMLRSDIANSICLWAKDLKDAGLFGVQWIIADLSAVQDYLEENLIKLGLSTRIIRGSTSAKKRQVILQEIIEGKVDCLIGSAPLAAGISIKELSVGWRLMPNSSSEENLAQQKGRLARPIEFKKTQSPIWIDFRIPGSLEYGAKKRFGLYKASTLGVVMCKPEDVVKTIMKEINGNQ